MSTRVILKCYLGKLNEYLLQWLSLRLAVDNKGQWSLLIGVMPRSGWNGIPYERSTYLPKDFHDTH